MKEESKKRVAKRVITFLMAVIIMLGSFMGNGNIVFARTYDSEETVIETGNLNKNGTTIFNGKVLTTEKLTDIHDGIIRALDDSTEVYETYTYGGDKYSNENSVFSKDYVQLNAGEIELSNVIVAESDITINASMMRSDEYTIVYSKTGNIHFNVGEMDFAGIIYAPNGEVTFSASNVCMQGRVIASELNIYVGTFEIDGLESYSNIVDNLEFLSDDMIFEITTEYNEENNKYLIDISSGNEEYFDRLEIYARYGEEEKFSYLCLFEEFENIGVR